MSTDDLINPKDFNSVELKISLMNTTTQTEVRDGYKMFGIQGVQGKPERTDILIQMIEILEDGFKLQIPSKICSKGHNTLIWVETLNHTPELKFECSGKVVEVKKADSSADEIEIKILQINDDQWKAFQSLFNRRQKEIEEFLKSVRGY